MLQVTGNYNGSPPPTSPADTTSKQRRLLNKLVRDLVAFTGTAITDMAAATPTAPRRQSRRITYRKNLTDAELDALIMQVGLGRWGSAYERATTPNNLPAKIITAIVTMLEYLGTDEREHLEAMQDNGEDTSEHIYLSVRAVTDWLDGEGITEAEVPPEAKQLTHLAAEKEAA